MKVTKRLNEVCKLLEASLEYVTNVEDEKTFESENNVVFVQENTR